MDKIRTYWSKFLLLCRNNKAGNAHAAPLLVLPSPTASSIYSCPPPIPAPSCKLALTPCPVTSE